MPPPVTADSLARKIVVAGGSGTAEDVAAVRPEIAKLSVELLTLFVAKGARVVACRDSVTDVETRLRDKVPRGWEGLRPRRTWDNVPGTYLTKGKRVIVATTAAAGGGRKVPDSGAGHGSSNLALHETLHGHHYLTKHRVLSAPRFVQARNADFGRLPDYLKQAERAGLEETYAESGARFFQHDAGLAGEWPALFAYWSGMPMPMIGAPRGSGIRGAVPQEEAAPEGPFVGTAQMAADGTITLDLRAGARGAVGHALFVLRPGDPDYEQVRAHSFSGGSARALASRQSAPRTALVRPFGGH